MATADLLRQLVTGVTVETAYLPTIELQDPFKPGPPNPLLQLLRPRVTLQVAGKPVRYAPYGEPGATRWPMVQTGLILGAGALALLLLAAVTRRNRRA